jgi:hypothetical protein
MNRRGFFGWLATLITGAAIAKPGQSVKPSDYTVHAEWPEDWYVDPLLYSGRCDTALVAVWLDPETGKYSNDPLIPPRAWQTLE